MKNVISIIITAILCYVIFVVLVLIVFYSQASMDLIVKKVGFKIKDYGYRDVFLGYNHFGCTGDCYHIYYFTYNDISGAKVIIYKAKIINDIFVSDNKLIAILPDGEVVIE